MVLFVMWPMLLLTEVFLCDKVIDDQQQCPPFKAMFIFDKHEFGLSFNQLRRFIRDFVEVLPDDTLLQVITVNKKESIKGRKKEIDKYWLNKIGVASNSSGIIKPSNIRDAISNFFDKTENPKMAEHIYLLVNEKTEIEDLKKVKEAMKHKTVQIILYGSHTKGDVWTNLSEDEQLIHVLGNDDEDINASVQSAKRQSCFGKDTPGTTPVINEQDDNPPKVHYFSYNPVYHIHPTINSVWLFCLSIYVLRDALVFVWNWFRATGEQSTRTGDQKRVTEQKNSFAKGTASASRQFIPEGKDIVDLHPVKTYKDDQGTKASDTKNSCDSVYIRCDDEEETENYQ